MKKVVYYTELGHVMVGERAVVVPVNHESPQVINGQPAVTTVVESYDRNTGVFETKNTIYKPNIILG